MRLNRHEEAVYYAIRLAEYTILAEELNKFEVRQNTPSIIKSMIKNANYHVKKARQFYPLIDAKELQKGIFRSIEQGEIDDKTLEQCRKFDNLAPELEWCLNHYEKTQGCEKTKTLEIVLRDLHRYNRYFDEQHPLVKSRADFVINIAKSLLHDLTTTPKTTPPTTAATPTVAPIATATAAATAAVGTKAEVKVGATEIPERVVEAAAAIAAATEVGWEGGLDEEVYEEIMAIREALKFI
jgi:hypothetical protein